MRFKILTLQLVICLFILSCKTDKREFLTVSLRSTVIGSCENDTVFVNYPKEVEIKNSMLFMLSNNAQHPINVYSYPELEFITYVGTKGRSREEMLSTSSFDIDDNFLYLIDTSTKKRLKYSLEDIAKGENKPCEVILLEEINTPTLSYAKTEDGFVSVSPLGDRFLFLNEMGCKMMSFGSTPWDKSSDTTEINPEIIPTLWDVDVDYCEDSKTVVAVTNLGDVIEIVNCETCKCKVIVGDDGLPGETINGNMKVVGKVDGFQDVNIYDNLIYALYCGDSYADLIKKWRNGEDTLNGGATIKVYTLCGEHIRSYELDRRITGFTIHDQKIIGLDANNNLFCGFDLK